MARPAPGADRTVAVLELLAAHPDERFTLSEVARFCDLNKATAHALLSALTERGVLLRHPEEKRYSLGPVLVAIGDAAGRGYTAADFVQPTLDHLAATTGLWARAWAIGRDHLGVVADAGRPGGRAGGGPARLPLVPPVGALPMAYADPATVEAWLARAPASAGAADAAEALPVIRRQGYSVTGASPEWRELTGTGPPADDPAGTEAAVRALLVAVARQRPLAGMLDRGDAARPADVAAPVFDGAGRVALVLSVTMADDRPLDAAHVRSLAAAVVAAADRLSAEVAGHHP